MRLGLVIYGSLDVVSGGYLYDRQLVDYLRRQGDVVDIVTLPWRDYGRHLLDNWRPSFRRRLLTAEYDILLQDQLNHPSLFWLNGRLRRQGRFPLVAVVHHLRSQESHPAAFRWLYRIVERLYLNQVDAFVYNSPDSQRTVRALLAGPRPGVVAPPAADHLQPEVTPAAIADRAWGPGPLRLLFVGNVTARKGVATLLRAAGRLPAGAVHLHLAGSRTAAPTYVARLATLAADLWPAGAPVTWHGAVADDALRDLYQHCHVFVMPSRYEGFGIAYLEAMGFGLPALGSTAGGAATIITPGENGYLVPPDDDVALAQHLARLADDRALLSRLGQQARSFFQAQPGWDETGRRVRAFLQTLVTA